MSVPQFRIDILNAAQQVQGDGPLLSAMAVNTTISLDQIGEATFSFPVTDPRGQYITAGSWFDLWATINNTARWLGRFLYDTEDVDPSYDSLTRRISAFGQMTELAFSPALFRRSYTYTPVNIVVEDLVTSVPGWGAQVDAGIGYTTVTYEGGSIFAAVDEMRDRWGQHFRLFSPSPGTRLLQFGAFGQPSGIRLLRMDGQVQSEYQADRRMAIINTLRVVQESGTIWNTVIPLGAGQGVSQLTIQEANLGTYSIQTGLNPDGSSYYYIQDASSVSQYGARWKELVFTQIRPLTNSQANIENAANALKLAAENWLSKHLAPKQTYQVQVNGLRKPLMPGDTVRLTYRGVAEKDDGSGYVYIDVDDDFYVMDIATDWVSGAVNLTISTTADRRTSDQDIMIDVIKDVKSLKLYVQPSVSDSMIGPYTRDIDNTHQVEFTISIGDETTYLNFAKLVFKTLPFRVNVTGSQAGGGTTQTSENDDSHAHLVGTIGVTSITPEDQAAEVSAFFRRYSGSTYTLYQRFLTGIEVDADIDQDDKWFTGNDYEGHSHEITIPSHTHNLNYGIYDDSVTPQTISIEINGVNRTVELGGPWAIEDSPVSIELDITDILVADGLRQNHQIVLSCVSGQGEIEFWCEMMKTIQAIALQ